ncbi:MAG: transcriptional repressor [Candidatus Pacebacteria bacterium]|nr:transcriptional repressor [Candidatus Paceibacterota bacterium]
MIKNSVSEIFCFRGQQSLRPTRQRLALARLLFLAADTGAQHHRHVTAEQLHSEVLASGVEVSLATVYNCLKQFTAAGLLRESMVVAGKTYYDTNTTDHHHFYLPESDQLVDIDPTKIALVSLPELPPGAEIERVEVVIRLKNKSPKI